MGSFLTFSWMKDWRTIAIVAVLVAGVLIEQVAKVDIPGVEFNWELVLVALGLRTAAVHEAK